MSDYYQTLGLSKGASDQDIKSAYRKLALKYHPDRNKGDKAAEAKFKEISEAYAVLSDPQKKQQYDTYGDSGFHQRYSTDDIFRGTDFGTIFNEFGFGNFDNIFDRMFGGGAGHGGGRRRGAAYQGQDLEYEVEISFDEAYRGSTREIRYQVPGAGSQSLQLKIPRGVKSGGRLRVAGKGGRSPHGGPSGDLYVVVRVAEHPHFSRRGQHIDVPISLKLTDAILGTSLEVPTPDGPARIRVPAGVKPGTKIRLRDRGFSAVGRGESGHLFAVVSVELPASLSSEQRDVVEKMRELGL